MNGDVVLLNSCLARGACADITFRDGVIHEIGDTEATGGTPKSDRENAAIDPLIDFRSLPPAPDAGGAPGERLRLTQSGCSQCLKWESLG